MHCRPKFSAKNNNFGIDTSASIASHQSLSNTSSRQANGNSSVCFYPSHKLFKLSQWSPRLLHLPAWDSITNNDRDIPPNFRQAVTDCYVQFEYSCKQLYISRWENFQINTGPKDLRQLLLEFPNLIKQNPMLWFPLSLAWFPSSSTSTLRI